MKVLFVYPGFQRHAEAHPELKQWVPMNEYFGSPSLGLSMMAAVTPPHIEFEYRDDRMGSALSTPTDADVVAMSFFTPAATRAFELADAFRALGKTVVAGGIFPTSMPDLCLQHFDAVVVGEGERVWPQLLSDFAAGQLKRRYTQPLDSLDDVPQPRLSMYFDAERTGFQPDDYPVQLTRGCPLSCQACVLPLSMGRSIREFSVDHTLAQLKQLTTRGKRACLTEDTSWFPGQTANHLMKLFRAMIANGLEASISYIGLSMPQMLVASDELLTTARAAGVTMFYLVGGFDPITTRAFTGKDDKALQRAHRAIERAHRFGIDPYTSFLLGNDGDDLQTADRMLAFAAASGIAKAEFAIFTPYPGTPAWTRLNTEERIISREWYRYNDANVVFQPAQMSPADLEAGYLHLWRKFYTDKRHYADWNQADRTIQF